MNRTSMYPTVSAIVFGLVSLAHLSRIVFAWPLEIGHSLVPGWYSIAGLIGSTALCAWGASAARATRRSP